MFEYLKPTWHKSQKSVVGAHVHAPAVAENDNENSTTSLPALDRTPKLFIGGKQARPDSGYSSAIYSSSGKLLGEVGEGNRKDLRNAVEAANAASGWSKATAHSRAQILYYIAENLSAREADFVARISSMTGNKKLAKLEVETCISRLFTYGAWADKYDGAIHNVPIRGVALAMNEPIGTVGLICPEEFPLLGLISLVAPAIAMGNTVIVVPSQTHPLAATDFYSVLETSDVPAGVVNIVTGDSSALAKTLADHLDVDAVWHAKHAEMIERASAANLKRTFNLEARDWLDTLQGEGREFLREASQVKNIWIPYGE
jgi:aldehyde dehydrogenase (NAD+)